MALSKKQNITRLPRAATASGAASALVFSARLSFDCCHWRKLFLDRAP